VDVFTTPAPSLPCNWSVTGECCDDIWDGASPELQQAAAEYGAFVVWAATGRRFGACERTVRPCGRQCDNCGQGWYWSDGSSCRTSLTVCGVTAGAATTVRLLHVCARMPGLPSWTGGVYPGDGCQRRRSSHRLGLVPGGRRQVAGPHGRGLLARLPELPASTTEARTPSR
jgi:hypothetical protein